MDKTLNIAICEDLDEERKELLSVLDSSKMAMNLSVFTCGEDFLAEYEIRKYDLILMDIYMDGMTGIETATEIRKMDDNVSIAFTTTSLDYALESYRLEALKYIEKPVTLKDVLPVLQMVYMQKEYVPKLLIRAKEKEEFVPLTDILYLEQKGSRYQTHLIDGRVLIATGKLANIMEDLEENFFYHCHKSFIVNFSYVKSLNKELLVFEMVKGDNVHIRRDGFWKTKRAYESFLFSNPKRGTKNEQ